MRGSHKLECWWSLSYSQYLTVPRSVMQAMPEEWQNKMADLLKELDETLVWRPQQGCYWVKLKDSKGKYASDPLADYRHPIEIPRQNSAGVL